MIIAVDFDGTIAEHKFPDIGRPVPGAFEWLKKFKEAGAKLILWTMRSDGRTGTGKENRPVLTEAVEFCRKNGIEFDGINENPSQKSWTCSPKAYAHVYVDDAAFGCPLMDSKEMGDRMMVNWDKVGPAILEQLKRQQEAPYHASPTRRPGSLVCGECPIGQATSPAPREAKGTTRRQSPPGRPHELGAP